MPLCDCARPSGRLCVVLTALCLSLVACSGTTKASTGRTERETDSVIAGSSVPGAPAVGKALNESDSAAARARLADSIGNSQ